MKLTRELKTAILVIGSILLFIWGYSFLKGSDIFNKYKLLYVEYESVEGLTKSAPVTINGLIIGQVKDITIEEKTGLMSVELQINTDFPISKSSTAIIYEPGFIGGKQIAIKPNFQDKSITESGDKLTAEVQKSLTAKMQDKLMPIQEKLEKMMVNADQLIVGLNTVLDKKSQENLKISLAELTITMQQLHKLSVGMNSILDNNKAKIGGITTNFEKISGDFSQISDSLKKADLGKTVKELNLTLVKVNSLMDGINSGKGTMGKLMKDEALYTNMSKTTKEFELLLQDLRLNPTRYINVSLFGKKNKDYTAPQPETTDKK